MADSADDLAGGPELDDEGCHLLVAGPIKDDTMAAGDEERIIAIDTVDAGEGLALGARLLCLDCVQQKQVNCDMTRV